LKGSCSLRSAYRDGVGEAVRRLKDFSMAVLSGDHDGERPRLESIFGKQSDLLFQQLPADKRTFIESWQADGRYVLMLGDGINDAAALEQADVGLAVAERTTAFTPGCDGILQGHALRRLPDFLEYARKSRTTLFSAFALTILYNFIAIAYAWQGQLTPVVAAILMPMSSITVVAWTVGWTWWKGRVLRT
jgi:Cu+-exporting ATPase